ncbi:MAG TPA: CU044_2847 family protein [Actinoplanes sp.]|jgi:hypothetical protein
MPYLDLPIDDTETILVEITEVGTTRAGAAEVIGRAGERLDEAVAKVVRMGHQIIKQARDAPRAPDAVEVELGLKLTARSNFVVAGTTGEANFKVTLKWNLAEK